MAQFACLRNKIHKILLNVDLQFMKLPPPLITIPNETLDHVDSPIQINTTDILKKNKSLNLR